MRLLRSLAEAQAWRRELDAGPRTPVAFVPTMGFLHAGHASLLGEARRRVPQGQGVSVLSIFVNPAQFDRKEDLAAYPRDEAGDLALARDCGVDVVLIPSDPAALYAGDHATWIEVQGLDRTLCGATRPGHFRGVCTVVAKLWGLVRPDVALFGCKDYQQLAIIRRMHRDLFLSGEIVGMPTVREPDGLAMSSRNARLSPSARARALEIPRALHAARAAFAAGARDAATLLAAAGAQLRPDRLDYLELVDADGLAPLARVDRAALLAVAAFYGGEAGAAGAPGVRLIDSAVLDPADPAADPEQFGARLRG